MKEYRDAHGGAPRSLAQEDAELKEKARASAKALGHTNLPSTHDVSAEGFLKGIRAGYDNLLAREIKKMPANADLVADLELKASEEKSEGYHKKLDESRRHLHKAKLELEELDTDDGSHISVGFIWFAIIVAAFCESFISYKAIGGLLDIGSNIVLWVILIGFTVLYVAIPKALHWYYTEFLEDKKYKVILAVIPIILLGAGYYCLGYLRMHYMQMQGSMDVNSDSTAPPAFIASPWVYLALSGMFLLATYYLNCMLPTRQQSKNKVGLEKKERALAKLESDVERYEGLLAQVPDHGKNSLIRASHSNEGRKDLYNEINAMFHQACGIFADTNLQYRTDGIRPKAFDVQIEDLKDVYINQ